MAIFGTGLVPGATELLQRTMGCLGAPGFGLKHPGILATLQVLGMI